MYTVKFTPNLKRFYPELGPMEVEGKTLYDVLKRIDEKHPGIIDYILDEQKRLRKHVNIFIGDEMVTDRVLLSDKLNESGDIYIMQALSGG